MLCKSLTLPLIPGLTTLRSYFWLAMHLIVLVNLWITTGPTKVNQNKSKTYQQRKLHPKLTFKTWITVTTNNIYISRERV